MLVPYLRKADTTLMLSKYLRRADTSLLNLTSRFATKLNISDTASMLTNYLRTGLADSSYLPLTGGTLTGGLTGTSINLSSTINSIGDIFLGSNSAYGDGLKTRYFKTTGISPYRDLFIGSVGTIGTWAGRMHFQTSYNTEVPTTAMTINEFGNINMNGTLGVTGATTLGSTLAVTGAATFSNTSTFIGNVGIGINSSTEKLHIFNNAGINPASTIAQIETSGSTLGYSAELRLINNNTNGRTYGFRSSGPGDNFVGSSNFGFVDYTANEVRLLINSSGNIGIGTITPNAKLEVHGSAVFNEGSTDSDFRVESDGNANMVFVDASTDRVGIGYASPTKTLDVNGEVRINTVTATPTSLLGKDDSNVVGTVTTVAQTGLMTRGETTATTGSPSATFTVTHGLGSTPTAVLVTSAGISGGDKIIFEVYTKNSTTFSVQAWNYDGTEASGKEVKIYWLALK